MKVSRFALLFCWIVLLNREASATPNYAPSSVSGDTVAVLVQSGTGQYPSADAYLLLPSGSNYSTISLDGGSTGSGTFIYTKTGNETASLSITNLQEGITSSVQVIFTSASSGSFNLTSSAGTQSGLFQFSYPRTTTQLAPLMLDGVSVVGVISSGSGSLRSSGGAYLRFGANNTFTDYKVVGSALVGSTGTYTYSPQSLTTGSATLTGADFTAPTTYTITASFSNQGSFSATATDGSTQAGTYYIVRDPVGDLFNLSVNFGSGWYWGFMGSVNTTSFNLNEGYIYHNEHGWLYTTGSDPSSVYLWDSQLGWLYTSSTNYPYLYSFTRNTWLFYEKGGNPSLRWFYDSRQGYGWFSVSE